MDAGSTRDGRRTRVAVVGMVLVLGCTVDDIRANDHINGWGAAQFYTSLDAARGSLQYELNNVISQGALNNWNAGGPCLVMNYWITVTALPSYTEHYAWRTHGANAADCFFGQSVIA